MNNSELLNADTNATESSHLSRGMAILSVSFRRSNLLSVFTYCIVSPTTLCRSF
jgi:hypothetical protein